MAGIIKIGFLVPYSSIHPQMSHEVMDGFMSALPEKYRRSFQFYPEFVNLGNDNDVTMGVNKLLMFHNVDVLSGFLSYQVLPVVVPLVAKKNKLCFFFDMGEYLPPLTKLPETFFFNSYNFWQLEYALGNWAQKKFGGKGALLMSVYDAGYHIHSSFWHGAVNAGAKEMDMHTIPYNPEFPNIQPLLHHFFEKIEKSKVDYLHVLLCGTEALDFFSLFKQTGLYKKIPLVVSPHMASDVILSKIDNLGLNFFSASGWNYKDQRDDNKKFINQYEAFIGKKATEYAVMGYEMGLAFLPIMPQLQRGDTESAIHFLRTYQIEGPRGPRNFWIDNKDENPVIEIEKIALQPLNITKMVVGQGQAMRYNHAVFEEIHDGCVSGWRNPYLCV
jgi:branched-chain amino acid transport system substrate-binding protein